MLYNQADFVTLCAHAVQEGAEIIEVKALNLAGGTALLPKTFSETNQGAGVVGESGFVYLATTSPSGRVPIQVRVNTLTGKLRTSPFIDPSAIAAFLAAPVA
jgi:hypothetical protein